MTVGHASSSATIAAIDRERRLLTLHQAAEQLSLSTRTVERLIADDELIARRLGGRVRIMQGDLDAFVDRAASRGSARSSEFDPDRPVPPGTDSARPALRQAG